MGTWYLSRELIGKPLISVTNGKRIAKVEGVLVDPEKLEVAGLVTSKGGLFKQEITVELGSKVEVWGEDALLVSDAEAPLSEDQVPDLGEWLSVSDRLKGREVVNAQGTRVGFLEDVLIDTRGRVVEYQLGQVFVEGEVTEAKRIPVERTRSLGQDVLVLEVAEKQAAGMAEASSESAT